MNRQKRICAWIFSAALLLTGCGREEAGPVPDGEERLCAVNPEGSSNAGELPPDLPTALASEADLTGEGGYLLLGEAAEGEIGLYCDNAKERTQVYLRYGTHFQAFSQSGVWTDPDLFPKVAWYDWDGDGAADLVVDYLRYEGVYFDGETASPGIVGEQVVYQWDGAQWTDLHFGSGGPDGGVEELCGYPRAEDMKNPG